MQSILWRIPSNLLAAGALAICVSAAASPPPKSNTRGLLTGGNGMTLYTYAPDGSGGVSHCQGACATVWPPYLANQGMKAHGGFGLVKREHGILQWSYHGQPLYRYAADTRPGMALGDGVNGVWRAVRIH